MKKMLILVLALALTLGVCTQALAADKYTMRRLRATMRSMARHTRRACRCFATR